MMIQSLPTYHNVGITLFNLEFWFTLLAIITGLCALFSLILSRNLSKKPIMIKSLDYIGSFFFVFLAAVLIRTFVFQAYRVPTGSLEPTILPGDFIFVNQYTYGLRLPVIHKKIVSLNEPKRGEIALFYWPINPDKILIKRIIGLPGDHIVYHDKQLFINGKIIQHQSPKVEKSIDPSTQVTKWTEKLPGKSHGIYHQSMFFSQEMFDIHVPKNHYFVMGDNRDASNDSRYWGYVPEANFIGKALAVIASWDSHQLTLRWHRSLTSLY